MSENIEKRTFSISTLCRDCIFAQFSDCFNKQTGCSLGRLDKFIEQDKVRVKVDKETGLEYSEITTVCNFHRTKAWGDFYSNHEQQLSKETEIKLDVIIPVLESDLSAEEQFITIKNNVLDVTKQTKKITKIFIPFYKLNFPLVWLTRFLDNEVKIKNEIIHLIGQYFIKNEECLINEAARKSNSMFYVVSLPKQKIPVDLLEKLNNIINVEAKQISMINPLDSIHGLVIQTKLHKILNGFSPEESLIVKIQKLAQEQNVPHMIKDYKDV